MSSTMLEQAIIDAKSLKEAAVKTAEEELLKKYSSQIKEAVENLLEQDEDPLTIGEDTSTETEDVVEELEMKALDGESNSDLEEGEMVELDLDALKEELEEAAKPDKNKDGIPDYAQDGKGKNDLGKADDLEETNEAVDVQDPEQPLDSDEINLEFIKNSRMSNYKDFIEKLASEYDEGKISYKDFLKKSMAPVIKTAELSKRLIN